MACTLLSLQRFNKMLLDLRKQKIYKWHLKVEKKGKLVKCFGKVGYVVLHYLSDRLLLDLTGLLERERDLLNGDLLLRASLGMNSRLSVGTKVTRDGEDRVCLRRDGETLSRLLRTVTGLLALRQQTQEIWLVFLVG